MPQYYIDKTGKTIFIMQDDGTTLIIRIVGNVLKVFKGPPPGVES